eukprot:79520-Alexandrium_andersonii.AAC.1
MHPFMPRCVPSMGRAEASQDPSPKPVEFKPVRVAAYHVVGGAGRACQSEVGCCFSVRRGTESSPTDPIALN